jgi:hypothetical protein
MNPLCASQSTVCGLAWKRYSRQTQLRDVAPALNGRASLARLARCARRRFPHQPQLGRGEHHVRPVRAWAGAQGTVLIGGRQRGFARDGCECPGERTQNTISPSHTTTGFTPLAPRQSCCPAPRPFDSICNCWMVRYCYGLFEETLRFRETRFAACRISACSVGDCRCIVVRQTSRRFGARSHKSHRQTTTDVRFAS